MNTRIETELAYCDGCQNDIRIGCYPVHPRQPPKVCGKLGPGDDHTLSLCATCHPPLARQLQAEIGTGSPYLSTPTDAYTVPARGGSGAIEIDCTGYVVEIRDPNNAGHSLLAEYGMNADAAIEAAVTGRDVLDQFRRLTADEINADADHPCNGCYAAGKDDICDAQVDAFGRSDCYCLPANSSRPARWHTAPVGTWAATAQVMAADDDSGFDWDTWKDEMKEGGC